MISAQIRKLIALGLIVCPLLIACGNEKKSEPAPSSSAAGSTSTEPSEPILEATTVKVEVGGKSLVQLTSFLDNFEITLPLDFRGTVLTEREIESFTSKIKADVAQLAEQIRAQCNSLRGSGGVVFAMNMRPSSVVDGFADNMNITIRGIKQKLTIKSVEGEIRKELTSQLPNAKIDVKQITGEAGPMLQFHFDSQEGAAKVNVSRFVYATLRKDQLFMVAFATAKKRAPTVVSEFTACAKSLSYL